MLKALDQNKIMRKIKEEGDEIENEIDTLSPTKINALNKVANLITIQSQQVPAEDFKYLEHSMRVKRPPIPEDNLYSLSKLNFLAIMLADVMFAFLL
jgi:hypothetical protein